MGKSVEVIWKRGQFAGYTDVFPIEEFALDVAGVERLHLIRGPNGGIYSARYRLYLQGISATLDYSAFAAFNKRAGIELGQMEFRFRTSSRTDVKQLLWKGQIVPAVDASVVVKAASEQTSMAEAVTSQHQAFARQLLRPGQARFRHRLDLAYGGRCCVSGCAVPWAIDSAHIMPYADKHSNSVANGLLLRSDLHALFDGNQLAVHPTSRIVYFSAEARDWDEYRDLHGKKTLLGSQPGFEQCTPGNFAFRARWKAFIREHGHP